MELAEQSPTSSAVCVNKLSCAIHSIQKSLQEQLPLTTLTLQTSDYERSLVLKVTFALGFTADQTMIHSA